LATELDDLDASVRRHDPDRWLASRFIPDVQDRADVIALYAFAHELARVAGAVSNALMGEIRLTWWAEAVAEIYDGKPVRQHPVILALARAVARHNLPHTLFDAMIEARYPELDNAPVDAEASEGSLMSLATIVLGGGDPQAISAAARVYAGQGDVSEANRLLQGFPVATFPAVAYASLAGHEQASALERRLRITWAVLRGRL
jgi:phytoene synthase